MTASHVLCPLDGSLHSLRALPTAADAASTLSLPLRIFSAVEDRHEVAHRSAQLHESAERFRLESSTEIEVVVDPHAHLGIAERAAAGEAFVVMATSTQPLLHRGYIGSAAETTIRTSREPVLAVGPRATTTLAEVDRVVVPVDGSALSVTAVDVGAEWARRLDRPLWIVTVLEPSHAQGGEHQLVQRLATTGAAGAIEAQWEVLHGDEAALAITAWSQGALVAMASNGRSGIKRLTIGSVAASTTRWASGPVLIAGPARPAHIEPLARSGAAAARDGSRG